MGWTTLNVYKTEKAIDILKREMNDGPWQLLDHSMRGTTLYWVMQYTKDGVTRAHGGVTLTTRSTPFKLSNYNEFSYKEMGEECGPYAYDCPKRLLDLLDRLDPSPSGHARDWRDRCRANLRVKAAARSHFKVFQGAAA